MHNCTHKKNFKWSSGPIELLGIKINCDATVNSDNFEEIMAKAHNTCNTWINRKASLYGKILIINSLIGSLFVYRMSTMLYLSDNQVEIFEKLVREFLWNGRKPKISLHTLQHTKEQGGLCLINIKAKQNTLRYPGYSDL